MACKIENLRSCIEECTLLDTGRKNRAEYYEEKREKFYFDSRLGRRIDIKNLHLYYQLNAASFTATPIKRVLSIDKKEDVFTVLIETYDDDTIKTSVRYFDSDKSFICRQYDPIKIIKRILIEPSFKQYFESKNHPSLNLNYDPRYELCTETCDEPITPQVSRVEELRQLLRKYTEKKSKSDIRYDTQSSYIENYFQAQNQRKLKQNQWYKNYLKRIDNENVRKELLGDRYINANTNHDKSQSEIDLYVPQLVPIVENIQIYPSRVKTPDFDTLRKRPLNTNHSEVESTLDNTEKLLKSIRISQEDKKQLINYTSEIEDDKKQLINEQKKLQSALARWKEIEEFERLEKSIEDGSGNDVVSDNGMFNLQTFIADITNKSYVEPNNDQKSYIEPNNNQKSYIEPNNDQKSYIEPNNNQKSYIETTPRQDDIDLCADLIDSPKKKAKKLPRIAKPNPINTEKNDIFNYDSDEPRENLIDYINITGRVQEPSSSSDSSMEINLEEEEPDLLYTEEPEECSLYDDCEIDPFSPKLQYHKLLSRMASPKALSPRAARYEEFMKKYKRQDDIQYSNERSELNIQHPQIKVEYKDSSRTLKQNDHQKMLDFARKQRDARERDARERDDVINNLYNLIGNKSNPITHFLIQDDISMTDLPKPPKLDERNDNINEDLKITDPISNSISNSINDKQ
jgi:hypothetical protein